MMNCYFAALRPPYYSEAFASAQSCDIPSRKSISASKEQLESTVSEMSEKRLEHDDYTVGWICPLEVEQTAALEMLDEEHELLPQPCGDHNVYSLGSIGGHNVVIAGLHTPGNSPAAAVVAQMRCTFSKIRFGLLVGIGGGVPTSTDNGLIRLGDVVVAKPTGEHSGTIQYDHGKAEIDHFRRTGYLAPPPAVLLNAAQDLAAKRARKRKDPILENIKRVDTSLPNLQKYKYPGPAQDHLYRPEYIHLDPGASCEKCGCDPTERVRRSNVDDQDYGDDRDDEDDEDDEGKINDQQVIVHRGTIASGEAVMRNGVLRDQLAAEHGVLCFEMEAAGALVDLPCIIIRGISDYADSHKNDQWHGYAAAAAAAYARQLFFHMPIEDVKRYTPLAFQNGIDPLSQQQDVKERELIIDWLTPVDYAPQQSDFIAGRQKGTGLWLLESTKFQEWLSNAKQKLLCSGFAGAGKTILFAIVVDYLNKMFKNDATVGIAYLYCNFQKQQQQKPLDLFASLLKQLVQGQSLFPENVISLYDQHKKARTRPSLREILEELQSIITKHSRTFILIDALDELQTSDMSYNEILSALFSLQTNCGANIFITSRQILEITREFEGENNSLEIRASDEDVEIYLNARIPQLLQSTIWKYSDLQDMIKREIVRAADGMFLLVQLHIDSLMSQPTPGHIKEALQNIPNGNEALDKTYEQAMRRIEGHKKGFRDLAKRVLSWVIHAKRPLNTRELQHSLAVKVGASKLNQDFLPEVEVLRSACAGLVTIDEESDIIRLVHYTTQEYFERTQAFWFPHAHRDIAMTCISYLSFDVFSSGLCLMKYEWDERLETYALYDYAARNWGHHARMAPTEVVERMILHFFKSNAKLSACSQAMKTSEGHFCSSRRRSSKQTTGVHLAAYFGLRQLVKLLLKKNYEPDSKDAEGETPLLLAAGNGCEEVVRLLLKHKTNVNVQGRDYRRTPLLAATAQKHEAVVQLLLEHKADVNAKGTRDECTALCVAASLGAEVLVRLLLKYKAYIDARDGNGRTPLLLAAENGHESLVRLLLRRKANIIVKDHLSRTALYIAARNGHEMVTRLLLEQNMDVNLKSLSGDTALLGAAEKKHDNILELLLEHGADAEAKNCYGERALYFAARSGRLNAVRLLIEYNVDINLKTSSGDTALLAAVENNYNAVVQLLIKHGADVNAKSISRGRTALNWAVRKRQMAIIEQLLSYKANNNIRDKFGKTPLYWAAQMGDEELVQLLLEHEADPHVKENYYGWTALYEPARNGHEKVVQLLLDHNADVNAKDQDNQTALYWAANNGREAVVQQLLNYGAEVDVKDSYGHTALYWATKNGHKKIVKRLINHKENVKVECNDNQKAVNLASGIVSARTPSDSQSQLLLEDREVEIYIIDITNKVVVVQTSLKIKCHELKGKISRSVPQGQMYLVHNGRRIPEDATLQDRKVVEGSRIDVLFPIWGPKKKRPMNRAGRPRLFPGLPNGGAVARGNNGF